MKVRSAGLKFKIATNFIWRVGRGVHHRDSTLPPYGWSGHEVNSERIFFLLDTASRASRCKVQVLFPGTNTATSNKREPICALLLPSVSAVWLSCSLEQKYPPPPEQNWTPRTSTDRSCALPAQSKSATSIKREPICAQLALSRLTTSNKLDPSAPCQSGQCDCLVQSNKLYCSQ